MDQNVKFEMIKLLVLKILFIYLFKRVGEVGLVGETG